MHVKKKNCCPVTNYILAYILFENERKIPICHTCQQITSLHFLFSQIFNITLVHMKLLGKSKRTDRLCQCKATTQKETLTEMMDMCTAEFCRGFSSNVVKN